VDTDLLRQCSLSFQNFLTLDSNCLETQGSDFSLKLWCTLHEWNPLLEFYEKFKIDTCILFVIPSTHHYHAWSLLHIIVVVVVVVTIMAIIIITIIINLLYAGYLQLYT
jgi:hypothetical protein